MTTVPIPPLPPLTIARALPRNPDVLVVGYTGEQLRELPAAVASAFAKRFGTTPADMAAALGAKPGDDHVITLPAAGDGPRIVVVGLESVPPTAEDLRRAAGAGVRHAAQTFGSARLSVAVALGSTDSAEAQAVAEGALLGSYRYAPISGKGNDDEGGIGAVTVVHGARDKLDDAAATAETVVRAVVAAREWVNIPANLLYPASFADHVRELMGRTRVSIAVLDDTVLARDGYGGLMAVGGGSSRPPRLVRLSYRPRGAKVHLALVGKGITFDTGGLNLKPAEGMYTMKCDMAGAAAAMAATWAIAQLGLKINVTTYGALAENMPSSTAYRPSDVLTMYGGTTVENGNSDAEGRLVMADALARSAEDQPDVIVDVATLTGACVVALGERTIGLMSNDQDTSDRVLDAAEAAGESVWPLPIPPEIRPKLDSKVADLRSTTSDRWAGALVAAAFLREFVPEGTPWAHLDIAGPAFNDKKPYGYVPAGGTGAGVRTLVSLARSLAG
jgi:leucyl aminopeptidase